MNNKDIRAIEFTERLPVGDAQIEHVAIYNESVIADSDVRDLILTGMWLHPHPSVIFTTKEQHDNVFGPIIETEE